MRLSHWMDALHCSPLCAALQAIFDQFQRNSLGGRYLIHCNPGLQSIPSQGRVTVTRSLQEKTRIHRMSPIL